MRHRLVLGVLVMTLAAGAWPSAPGLGAEPSPPTAPACALRADAARVGPDPLTTVTALANSVEDTSDVGAGRFALCLSDGRAIRGRATCWWTEDRSEIRYVNSASFRIDGHRADAGIGWAPAGHRFVLDALGRGWYDSTLGGALEVSAPLEREGTAIFTGIPGQEGAPGAVSGAYRWHCDDPPRRDVGTTVGTVTWTMDGPAPGTYTARALCRWERRPGGMAVGRVEAYEWPQAAGAGRWVNITLGLSPDAPEPSISVYVDLFDDTSERLAEWADTFSALVTARPAGGATGTARVLAFRPGAADEDPEKLLAPDQFTGTVRWSCGEPPRRTDVRYPWHRPRTTPGSVALTFRDAPIREFAVRATCGPAVVGELAISGLRTQLWALAENRYVLLVLGPDGEPLGEYIAEPGDDGLIGSQESEDGTWRQTVAMDFVPGSGPTPPPLFEGIEGGFRAAVTTDCPGSER